MPSDQDTRSLERNALLELHRKTTLAITLLVGPAVVCALALQALEIPVWQFWLLTAWMAATTLCWGLAHVLTRRGRLELAVGLVVFSAFVFDGAALTLREGTLACALVADVGMVIYASVFAPSLMVPSAVFAIGSIAVLRVLGHLGWLPIAAATPHLALLLDLSVIVAALSVVVFFVHRRGRIGELPYVALKKVLREQEDTLATIVRLQPHIDVLVEAGERTASVLATRAKHQASTAEEVSNLIMAFEGMLTDAASSARATHQVTEKTQSESASGAARLALASEKLERFGRTMEEIRSSMGHLSVQTGRTEEIIDLLREIDSQLGVLGLNASLVAVRAGEAGKGFSVVAREIQTLLRSSETSLQRGRGMLATIRGEAGQVLELTEKSASQLAEHLRAVREACETMTRLSEQFVGASRTVIGLAQQADRQQGQLQRASQVLGELRRSAAQLTSSAQELSQSMRQLVRGQEELRTLVQRDRSASTAA